MTTKEEYRSRWKKLESEISDLEKQKDEAYKRLPAVPHDSEEWKKAFNKYFHEVAQPIDERISNLKCEAEYCRIRSLDVYYCNRFLYSDIQPYEVIEVISDKRLKLRSMNTVQSEKGMERLKESYTPGGFVGNFDNSVQEWICTPDQNGIVVEVRQHKDGRFYEQNDSTPYILSDCPKKYRDFNF